MIFLSRIKINTIIYSYDTDIYKIFKGVTFRSNEINKFEYKSYKNYFVFYASKIKNYFDEFFGFLKELVNIESIYVNEIIIIKDFQDLNTIQQNVLKSFFTKRLFILITNKHGMINRNILSYFVTYTKVK